MAEFDKDHPNCRCEWQPVGSHPLQVALEQLDALQFEIGLRYPGRTFMGRVVIVLEWQKGDGRWDTETDDLEQLGLLALGWLAARLRGDGDEHDYAREL